MSLFTHLHVHTEYSPLDGMSKVKELVEIAKEMGHTALAVTDHGSCAGHKDLEIECKKAGIKPIYGCEFYMSANEVAQKDDQGLHLIVFAKNDEGLRNLYQLYHESYDNFYRKPHINIHLLKKFKEGLIVSSACIGGVIAQNIMQGHYDIAKQWVNDFKSIFKDDFYLEVQPNDIPDQYIVNREVFRLGRETNTKIIATNDVHYTYKDDAKTHEVLLAMQVKQKWHDEKRFKFPTNDYWFKSYDEMVDTFVGSISDKKEYIQALKNTLEITEKCTIIDLPKGDFMPHYNKLEEGKTEREVLEELVWDGFEKRWHQDDPKLIEQVKHELDVIDGEGYSGYFLIVQDYIKEARKRNVIVSDGRGSGAGCKVSFLTDITRVDPVKHGLIFERFLDVGRVPDIDTDFSDQETVFKYLQEQYGERNVARIIAFSSLTAKLATRRVLGVFDKSQVEIAKVIGYMPNKLSFTMKEALEYSQQLVAYFNQSEEHKFMLKCILRLENVIPNETIHAGGVVIYPEIYKYIPVKMVNDSKGNRTIPVAMLSKYPLEDAGFVKFDVLGLETLPVLNHTLDLIEKNTGVRPELPTDLNSNFDDPKVYEVLQKGETLGVFQLASQASYTKEIAPRRFEDIVAISSIIRPGTGDINEFIARRNGKEWYIAPERQRYMNESQGLMIYQEQYLHDAHTYAGWAYGFSDKNIRKNKKLREDTTLMEKFIKDSVDRGFNEDEMRKLWLQIVEVAGGGYGFNKSHAVSYSVLSYQCAWLKTYFPQYFYSALLSSKMNAQDWKEQVSNIISACKRENIKMLPPDLNKSMGEFMPTDEGIRVPLNYLSGVGDSVIPELERIRPITNLQDLFDRRTKSIVKKNTIVAMIKAGCFDFEDTRANMMWKHDMLNRTKTQIKNEVILENNYPNDEKTYMAWEKEALGLCLTKHPLDNHNPKAIWEFEEGGRASIVAEITDVTARPQKNGKMMAFIMLETPFGVHKGLCFANTWANESIRELAIVGKIVYVTGKRSANDILIDDMEELEI